MSKPPVVPLLIQLGVLPSKLENMIAGLKQIFMNSGSLAIRN